MKTGAVDSAGGIAAWVAGGMARKGACCTDSGPSGAGMDLRAALTYAILKGV